MSGVQIPPPLPKKMLQTIKNTLTNKKFHTFFKIIAFISVIYILSQKLSYENILNSFEFSSYIFLILLLIFLIRSISMVFTFLRWQNLLYSKNKNKVSFNALLAPLLYSELTLQFGFLGQVFSRAVLTKKNIDLNLIVSSTIVEKIISASILIFLSFITLTIYLFIFGLINSVLISSYIAISILIIIFLISIYLIDKNNFQLIQNLNKIFIIKYFAHYLELRLIKLSFLYSLIIQILGLVTLFLTSLIFNFDFSFIQFILLMPLALLVANIPITFFQFGWRELVFMYVFNILLITNEEIFLIGFSLGLAGGFTSIVHVLIYESILIIKKLNLAKK